MSWNPKDFPEYSSTENSDDIDYSNPAFYKQGTPKTPYTSQPVQFLDPQASYTDHPYQSSDMNGNDPILMTPYRGPSDIEGYTADVGAEQREAARRDSSEGRKKRKGLPGLCGCRAAQS